MLSGYIGQKKKIYKKEEMKIKYILGIGLKSYCWGFFVFLYINMFQIEENWRYFSITNKKWSPFS
jgi:hypothetical protein